LGLNPCRGGAKKQGYFLKNCHGGGGHHNRRLIRGNLFSLCPKLGNPWEAQGAFWAQFGKGVGGPSFGPHECVRAPTSGPNRGAPGKPPTRPVQWGASTKRRKKTQHTPGAAFLQARLSKKKGRGICRYKPGRDWAAKGSFIRGGRTRAGQTGGGGFAERSRPFCSGHPPGCLPWAGGGGWAGSSLRLGRQQNPRGRGASPFVKKQRRLLAAPTPTRGKTPAAGPGPPKTQKGKGPNGGQTPKN